MGLLKALFGNYSEKEIKRIKPMQEKVLVLDEEYQKLTDDELRHKTDEFKERLSAGERSTIFCPRLLLLAEKLQAACSV